MSVRPTSSPNIMRARAAAIARKLADKWEARGNAAHDITCTFAGEVAREIENAILKLKVSPK